MRRVVLFAAFVLALFAARPAHAADEEEQEPVPPGYHVERHARTGMIVGGAILFSVAYGLPAAVPAICECSLEEFRWLYVPVIGPPIYGAARGGGELGLAMLGFGVAQAGGIALVTAGIVGRKVLVRDDGTSVSVAPSAAGAPMGLTVAGTW